MIELALIVGILGPVFLLGTTELSMFVFASVELADATQAAASYASQYYFENSNSTLPTQSQVTAAATNDSPELSALLSSGSSFTATVATGCGSGSATSGNTVPTCSSGSLPYVQVTGQAKIAPFVSFLQMQSITMTSQARMNLVK